MAHQVHIAFATVLKSFQFLRRWPALAAHAKSSAVLGSRDERHDVVQESAARFDRLVDLDQMAIIDAGDHHRIDLAQNAARSQHLQAQQLTLTEYSRGVNAGPALVLVIDPRVDVL